MLWKHVSEVQFLDWLSFFKKCILCKNCDNSQEHIINDCAKTGKLRKKLTKELNDLNNATKNKKLSDSIFYWYYSKDLKDKKSDNKGIRLIKKYDLKIIN